MGGYVYLMSNRKNGTLYCGVTNNIARRAYEHRMGICRGFTKRYGLKRLVWYTFFDDISDAIAHESAIKHWTRARKVRMIHDMNPNWDDLYEQLLW